MNNVTFDGNAANAHGGAIDAEFSQIRIASSTFVGNRACIGVGGAIRFQFQADSMANEAANIQNGKKDY